MPHRRPRYFSYNSDGYDDTDWGCVYRSFQNAIMGAFGVTDVDDMPFVPTLPDLLHATRRRRGQWAEPAMLVPAARALGLRTRTFWTGTNSDELFRLTPASAYTHVTQKQFSPHRTRGAYVIDDGISAYAVVRHPNSGRWLLVDPHFTPARVTTFKQSKLSQHNWMVLHVWQSSKKKPKTKSKMKQTTT